MSTDALVLLEDDHKEIRKLFRDFRGAGPNARVENCVSSFRMSRTTFSSRMKSIMSRTCW